MKNEAYTKVQETIYFYFIKKCEVQEKHWGWFFTDKYILLFIEEKGSQKLKN